jgi:Uri superfamily endonuclease
MKEYCGCCSVVKGHKVRSTRKISRDDSEPGRNWHVDLIGNRVPQVPIGKRAGDMDLA